MRAIWAVLLLASLTGCSWITDLVITNKTAQALSVMYRLEDMEGKPHCPDSSPDGNFLSPAMKPVDDVANRDVPWRTAGYECNPADKIVRLSLPPQMALRIDRKNTFTGHKNESDYAKFVHVPLAVQLLQLRGANGALTYEGSKVTKDFVKVSRGLSVLTYE